MSENSTGSRPRRSVLYMPASNQRALEKGKSLKADALILDLEDSVAPDEKETARAQAIAAVQQGGYAQKELIIRMNALDSPWGEADVKAIAGSKADAILIPKVNHAKDVEQIEKLLESSKSQHLKIWCMIETPLGVLNCKEIAGSSPHLDCLVMGTSDLAKDLNAEHTPDRLPFLTSLLLSILAAKAYGISILDGVYLNLEDEDGFAKACKQGKSFGFDGKTLIHPKTIDLANQIFAPSAQDIAQAHKIISAYDQALKEKKGVIVVDGKLIENLHVTQAKRLIELSTLIQQNQ